MIGQTLSHYKITAALAAGIAAFLIVGLYVTSKDPLFLALTGIVGLGMLLTAAGILTDRRRS